jgi:ATP-dependent Clp protease ATP-binding subunit ClpA
MNDSRNGDELMKLCDRCKKNVAVVYTTKLENGKQTQMGLCIPCAKELGIEPLDQVMDQMKMSPEDYANLNAQMMQMFENIDQDQLQEAMQGMMTMNPEDMENNPMFQQFQAMLGNDGMDDFQGFQSPDEEEIDEEDEDFDEPKESAQGRNKKRTKTKKQKNRKRKSLEAYGTNLTDLAKNDSLDRVIGRHREVDRLMQILNRRSKNNPVLIGEPGVGKTAIAEGLAVRIAEKKVPAKLLNSEIYLLDLTALVAGTQFRGQFENRMKALLKEAAAEGNIILVIDELHNIAGAGEAESGAMNAANILKPALARGEIQIIGATTLDEYRKYIEKDAALERRFQPILVEEPSLEETVEILKGIRSYYEDFHKVAIPDDLIQTAVEMSERYITDRFLPDKAIDVIDEAGSRANLKNLGLVEIAALQDELVKIQEEKEDAAEAGQYELAAEKKSEELRIEKKIEDLETEFGQVALTREDIASVIEAWTKIPVQKITEFEADRLMQLEDRLHKRVIAQDRAVKALSKTIRRKRSGFHRDKKPASFIFVGPTGVGKTELARSVAIELFGSEEAMIRLDMSEYMEKHTVSKLIGAPPGYVGYDQGGFLTEKIRRKPYALVLLDEIEKAHPDVFHMLLQILEDGRLTDSQGRTVHFENTVIIMTSNAGTQTRSAKLGFGNQGDQIEAEASKEALRKFFRPEFLNRIDEIISFHRLKPDHLLEIIELQLNEIAMELHAKKMKLDVSDEAKKHLVDLGYSVQYGARPLRRTLQRLIEDELAERFLRSELTEGDTASFDLVDGKIKLTIKHQE